MLYESWHRAVVEKLSSLRDENKWPALVKVHENLYTLLIRQRKKVEEPTAKLATKIDQPPIRNTAKQGNCYKLTS